MQKRNPSSRPQSAWYVASQCLRLAVSSAQAALVSVHADLHPIVSAATGEFSVCELVPLAKRETGPHPCVTRIISYLSGLGVAISVTFAHCIKIERGRFRP